MSQFRYNNTPIAIKAPIAAITNAIGLVRNAIALANVLVTAAPTVAMAVHNVNPDVANACCML